MSPESSLGTIWNDRYAVFTGDKKLLATGNEQTRPLHMFSSTLLTAEWTEFHFNWRQLAKTQQTQEQNYSILSGSNTLLPSKGNIAGSINLVNLNVYL